MSKLMFNGRCYSYGGEPLVQPVIYSEDEREIGCWTDGRPLYQKTLCLGIITKDTNWHYSPHGINNIDKIVSCQGIMGEVNNTTFAPIPNYRPGYSMGICIEVDQTNIGYMQNWLDSPSDQTYVTIQYTKTTDQPGSGTWIPSGALATHYSTDEQVVGTWIDGSTLYEKTINLTGLSYATGAWTVGILGTTDIEIQSWSGWYKISSNDTKYPINSYYRTSSIYACTSLSSTKNEDISFYNNMGYTVKEICVTIRYIKREVTA